MSIHVISVRQSFTKAESSDKFRRALHKQLHLPPDNCVFADKIYYKGLENQAWRCPGVIIFQDGYSVFIIHEGISVTV